MTLAIGELTGLGKTNTNDNNGNVQTTKLYNNYIYIPGSFLVSFIWKQKVASIDDFVEYLRTIIIAINSFEVLIHGRYGNTSSNNDVYAVSYENNTLYMLIRKSDGNIDKREVYSLENPGEIDKWYFFSVELF